MRKSNPKVILITVGLFLFVVLIVVNVGYIALAKKHLRTGTDIIAFQQNKALEEVEEIGKRGTIYDRNGEVIAQDIERYQIYLVLDKSLVDVATKNPLYVTDIKKTAEVLNKHTGIPSEDAVALLSNPDAKQVEIGTYGKALTKEVKEAIEKEELPGIRFKQVMERVYPSGYFMSNILGFARYNSEQDRIVGEMGLEAYLDDYLKGENGLKQYTIGKYGQIIPGQEKTIKLVKNGNDVHLTIDKNIQSAVESMLKEDDEIERWAVVMNAKTGELLGAGSSTGFDLNKKDIKSYTNMIADVSYEPGSVAKVFTYATAMDTDNLDDQKTVASGSFYVGLDDDGNPIRLPSSGGSINTIKDAFNANYGYITYKQGLAYSTNTTAVDLLVNHIKTKTYLEYLDKFKLYEDVDVQGITSVVGLKNTSGPLEIVNTAFGQGSSTTALNLVQGFSAIVNNGIMSKPYIISSVIDPYTNKKTIENKPVHTEVLKSSTAEKMNEYLRAPVEEDYGTVRHYRLNDIKILGKSGTAELVIDGRYSDSIFINSVILAAPADNPEIILYYAQKSSVYDRPKYDKVKSTLKVALDKLLINNKSKVEQNKDFTVTNMPNVINHTLDYVTNRLEKSHINQIVIGNGNSVIKQYPLENETLVNDRKVFIYTGGVVTMPDMNGWSYKEVVAFSRLSGIGIQIKGTGKVVSQNISANTTITSDSQIEVELK